MLRSRVPLFALAISMFFLPAADAAVPSSLKTSCLTKTVADAPTYSYQFCDDGLPPIGVFGANPNEGAVNAVPVPAKYNGYIGLPAKAADANTVPGHDSNNDIALDVDISMPTTPPPAAGYPLIVLMHGCCNGTKKSWESNLFKPPGGAFGNDNWHYGNAWFASRGYVVINYSSRGFFAGLDPNQRGSTGETQLDSRRYELNDFQSLAGQVADDPFFHVDPTRIVASGGSYGGGFSWMALTDPIWQSPGGKQMKLAAVAPKYGWTDLLYSLVPNGHHSTDAANMPAFDGSSTTAPVGTGKTSIIAVLYGLGTGVLGGGTTFPATFPDDKDCIDNGEPIDTDPICAGTLSRVGEFINDRSAYYQTDFFNKIQTDANYRIPVFAYAPWTDPLFTPVENLRMYNRIRSLVPKYPIQMVVGDSTPHFAQTKEKEWGDLCGNDQHVCLVPDFPSQDVDRKPQNRMRTGITTYLNRFIDYYAKPAHDPRPARPRREVRASVERCQQTGLTAEQAALPGTDYRARTFDRLARRALTINYSGSKTTESQITDTGGHAAHAEPFTRFGHCVADTAPAGPGAAVYTSVPLTRDTTMLGLPKLTVNFNETSSTNAKNLQLNARLYDVLPQPDPASGAIQVMADRGPYRVTPGTTSGPVSFQLYGNGWTFPKGHRIRIEIVQDDDVVGAASLFEAAGGFVRQSTTESSIAFGNVKLELPIRHGGQTISGAAGN